jgi:hypothetical protein
VEVAYIEGKRQWEGCGGFGTNLCRTKTHIWNKLKYELLRLGFLSLISGQTGQWGSCGEFEAELWPKVDQTPAYETNYNMRCWYCRD